MLKDKLFNKPPHLFQFNIGTPCLLFFLICLLIILIVISMWFVYTFISCCLLFNFHLILLLLLLLIWHTGCLRRKLGISSLKISSKWQNCDNNASKPWKIDLFFSLQQFMGNLNKKIGVVYLFKHLMNVINKKLVFF